MGRRNTVRPTTGTPLVSTAPSQTRPRAAGARRSLCAFNVDGLHPTHRPRDLPRPGGHRHPTDRATTARSRCTPSSCGGAAAPTTARRAPPSTFIYNTREEVVCVCVCVCVDILCAELESTIVGRVTIPAPRVSRTVRENDFREDANELCVRGSSSGRGVHHARAAAGRPRGR